MATLAGLQSMGREVYLSSVELAALAGPHDVSGVGDRDGPVKTLPKRVTHEGAWPGMMAADAGMDVADQLLALGTGMHRCITPEGLRLFSTLSIRMTDLARLARRHA